MQEWLKNLKVGDKVIVSIFYINLQQHIDEVVRLTKTQIILKNSSSRFRRSDGVRIGDKGFSKGYLEEATEEKIKKIERENARLKLIHKIKKTDWNKIELGKLIKIKEILDKE